MKVRCQLCDAMLYDGPAENTRGEVFPDAEVTVFQMARDGHSIWELRRIDTGAPIRGDGHQCPVLA